MEDKTQDKRLPPKTIPGKLPGTVQPQHVRCGKPNCKCAAGELHGPYWYRIWRDEGGKQHKEYVRKPDLERVQAACEARQQELREAQAVLARGREAVKSHADCNAGIRKCCGNLEALKAYLYEPLWLAEELAELSLSGKGGIMVKIEAFRLYVMLVDCLGRMQHELRELQSPRDDLYAQIIGRA